MKMDVGLDTGPVALKQIVPIGTEITAGELHDTLMSAGSELMVQAMAKLQDDALHLTAQNEDGANYARKIDKGETRIDWEKSAQDVHNHVRGLSPFPGSWCEMEIGGTLERVKILRTVIADGTGVAGEILGGLTIACGQGSVSIIELQRAGGKPLSAGDFLRGAALTKVI
jgi:methionyl-tRNA formyltransferase